MNIKIIFFLGYLITEQQNLKEACNRSFNISFDRFYKILSEHVLFDGF